MKKNKKKLKEWKTGMKMAKKRVKRAQELFALLKLDKDISNEAIKILSPNPKLLALLQECKIALRIWRDDPATKELAKGTSEELIKKIEEVI